ncbi:cytochrome P460 family protein [Sulfurovum sp. CS9]|uniref:cytochrome P460 family protein n=1 Tax=Sulfurovum sp. CS9 TaxID=3391146 RepID=UPI0039E9A2D4
MKKLVLASLLPLGSMKPVLLSFILSTMIMLDLSASQTDNDEGVIKHDYKNQFTFPRWKSLHKLNTETLVSADHNAWFDIYVNTIAKKAYVEKLSLLPVGSIILKPLYPDLQRSKTAKLTIMIKMEKGYDPENGDWWYGVYDESGMEGYYQGKIKSCIKCHTQAKETDYMFSESVIESINEEEW